MKSLEILLLNGRRSNTRETEQVLAVLAGPRMALRAEQAFSVLGVSETR